MVSSILTWHGYSVTREYYYNNAGKQMRMLAESTYAKYATKIGRDVTAPENGYIGPVSYTHLTLPTILLV